MTNDRQPGVKHHTQQQLLEIERVIKGEPYVSALRDEVVAYARKQGGLTLDFWRLFQGPWFGEPWMMTLERCSERLDVPVSELTRIGDETLAAVEPRVEHLRPPDAPRPQRP